MTKISICGVDGSGKTTLLAALRQLARGGPEPVAVLHAPQYYFGHELGVTPLARKFEALGLHADRSEEPQLKACALFLAMTLYGRAESEVIASTGAATLFRERDPIADSITYAQVYVQLLTRPLSDELVASHLDDEIRAYLGEIDQIAALEFDPLTFKQLPLFVQAVFSTPFPQLVTVLDALYGTSTADTIVFLQLSPEMMEKRMAMKAAGSQQPREFHEKHDTLLRLQAGMERAISALAQLQKLDVLMLPVDDRPPEAVARQLFDRYAR